MLAKNNLKEIEEEVIAECYDDIDDTNENSGSDSPDSDEENDKPDPKILDKFKVRIINIYLISKISHVFFTFYLGSSWLSKQVKCIS